MFGFFMFAQPMFADVPRFQGSSGSGGGGGTSRRKKHPADERREFENRLEITLISFLNTQE